MTSENVGTRQCKLKLQSEISPEMKAIIRQNFGCSKTMQEMLQNNDSRVLCPKLAGFITDFFGAGGRQTCPTSESEHEANKTIEEKALGMLNTIGTHTDRLNRLNYEIKHVINDD